jgi:hypothetical protein
MASETTPLLLAAEPALVTAVLPTGFFSAKRRVLFTSFILSLAFRCVGAPKASSIVHVSLLSALPLPPACSPQLHPDAAAVLCPRHGL